MVASNTFNKIVVSKHSHNGSVNEAKYSHNKIRSHCVSVRLNDDELTLLNERRTVIVKANGFAWRFCITSPQLFHRLISKHGKPLVRFHIS